MLTDREKWLMEQAWDVSKVDTRFYFNQWLLDMAADSVTVEMVLEKDAPISDHEAAIKQAKTIGYAQGYEDGFTDGDQDTYLSSYKEPK